ncbi:MAG: hypothetical protein KKB37_00805, partial [Alphaproteobacteria bacterium]|nr:hypothetical protein [Alphaproteobacteria bacterium]
MSDEAQLGKAIELFKEGSYSQTIAAVDLIADSGAAHAPAILSALSSRRVYVDETGATAFYRSDNDYY